MLDNLFTSSASVWAGLVSAAVLLPVLIHLINLVRYKKVPFAAMEFLLKSQKQSKNYVWLKQLLLLLTRVAALVLALFLISQAGCQEDRIARILGGRSTHHYVLLDDSFSMTDKGDSSNSGTGDASTTAFDHAKNVLTSIAGRVSNRQNQKFSLVRFSAGERADNDAGVRFDLENRLVDSTFGNLLDEAKGNLAPSALAVDARSIISQVSAVARQRTDENPIMYVLSDFRSKDWELTGDIESDLLAIKESGGAVELINCTSAASPNLAVVDLQPASNVRVANTPLMMEVKIKNLSDSPITKFRALVNTDMFSQATSPTGLVKKTEDLPAIFIQKIEAKETVTRLFPVFFSSPGQHAITVRIPDDAVAVDNSRSCSITIEEKAQVLLIDDANQKHASFVGLALNPNQLTGIAPEVQPKTFLRDAEAETLSQYDVIYLLDIDALDDAAVRALKSFCQAGGGLAYFLGPKSSVTFYNTLFGSGDGIFPVELEQTVDVEEDPQSTSADFLPLDHPIFAPVLHQKTSLLDLVDVEKTIVPTREWLLSPPANAKVIATVRGDQRRPLMVESSFGDGRIVVCTTSAGPIWNNWSRNATYLPILLLLEDYLAGGKNQTADLTLSSSLTLAKDATQFLPDATLLSPIPGSEERESSDLKLTAANGNQILQAELPTYNPTGRANLTLPGVYDFWFQESNGAWAVDRAAINVDSAEGNLETIAPGQLLTNLSSVQPTWVNWNQFNPEPDLKPASSLSRLFLLLLLMVFAIEPLLAYLSSFHHA